MSMRLIGYLLRLCKPLRGYGRFGGRGLAKPLLRSNDGGRAPDIPGTCGIRTPHSAAGARRRAKLGCAPDPLGHAARRPPPPPPHLPPPPPPPPAPPDDSRPEFLDLILAVKVVASLDAAIAHIEANGSPHSDCIITADETAASHFLAEVDSATVYWNAST